MSRIVLVVAAGVGVAVLGCPAVGQPGRQKVSDPLKGEIQGEPVSRIWFGNNGATTLHTAEVPITLKAGTPVGVVVTVAGTGRTVVVDLKDPSGAVVGGSKVRTARTARFAVDQVGAAGEHTLVIGSDRVGEFTVQVIGEAADQFNIQALEERLKHLKREVAEVEARLKKLKEKK